MTQITDGLLIKISQTGGGKLKADLQDVAHGLDNVDDSAKKAGRGMQAFTRGAGLVAGVLGTLGLTSLAQKMREVAIGSENTTARFEQLYSSSAQAERSLLRLAQGTADIPGRFVEISDAAAKLKNLNLDDSVDTILALGNVSAGSKKSLDQLIEAVADATTGEFERLKEFGIKTRSEGDTVKFTFRGLTTAIKNDSASITEYLTNLGRVEYAGALAGQAEALEGSMGLLGKAFDHAAGKFGEKSGFNRALKSVTQNVTDMLNKLSDAPQSIAALSAEVDKLAAGGTGRGRNRAQQGTAAQLVEARRELDNALIIQGGEAGLAAANRRLAEEIAKREALAEKLGDVDANMSGKYRGGRRTSPLAALEADIEALRRERDLIEAELERDTVNGIAFGAGDPVNDPATQIAQAAAKKQIELLSREKALYGEVTRAAAIRYELESGALAALDDPSRKRLLALANELDAMDQAKQAHESRASAAMLAAQQEAGALEQMAQGLRDYQAEQARAGENLRLSVRTPTEQYNDKIAGYEELLAAGDITRETFKRAVAAAKQDLSGLDDSVKTLGASIKEEFGSWGNQLASAMAEATLTSKANFSDFANSVIRDLLRIFYQKQIIDKVAAFDWGSLFGGSSSSAPASTGAAAVAPIGGLLAPDRTAPAGEGMGFDVRITNEGQPKTARVGRARFDQDLKKMVVEIMMTDHQQSGPYSSLVANTTNMRRVVG